MKAQGTKHSLFKKVGIKTMQNYCGILGIIPSSKGASGKMKNDLFYLESLYFLLHL